MINIRAMNSANPLLSTTARTIAYGMKSAGGFAMVVFMALVIRNREACGGGLQKAAYCAVYVDI